MNIAGTGADITTIANISRRGFLHGILGSGALLLGAHYVPMLLDSDETVPDKMRLDPATFHPNVFVGIDVDGTVHIVASRSEMGTMIRTTLPMIVADELDADWKRVKIEQAIGDLRYGDQNTNGSHSIRNFFDIMRQAGATARLMLIQAAAQQWGIRPPSALPICTLSCIRLPLGVLGTANLPRQHRSAGSKKRRFAI